jgi:hypothetical protein
MIRLGTITTTTTNRHGQEREQQRRVVAIRGELDRREQSGPFVAWCAVVPLRSIAAGSWTLAVAITIGAAIAQLTS